MVGKYTMQVVGRRQQQRGRQVDEAGGREVPTTDLLDYLHLTRTSGTYLLQQYCYFRRSKIQDMDTYGGREVVGSSTEEVGSI